MIRGRWWVEKESRKEERDGEKRFDDRLDLSSTFLVAIRGPARLGRTGCKRGTF